MKAVNYIVRMRFMVDFLLMRKSFKTGIFLNLYIFKFIEKIIVERLYNSTLITAAVSTFLTLEKAVEVLAETVAPLKGSLT